MPNLYDLLCGLNTLLARQQGVALSTPSPVIPEIPDYLKQPKTADQKAVEFEARSLGQRERTDRPPARPRYTLQEGRALAARLRARKQAQAAAAPVQPPDPREPVQAPLLLQGVQPMSDEITPERRQAVVDELMGTRGPRPPSPGDDGRLARAIAAVQQKATSAASDEQLASMVVREDRSLWPEGESWSAFLARVRAAGREAGYASATGVHAQNARPRGAQGQGAPARKPQLREEGPYALSLAEEDRRQTAVAELMSNISLEGRRPRPLPTPGVSLSVAEVGRATEIMRELERNRVVQPRR